MLHCLIALLLATFFVVPVIAAESSDLPPSITVSGEGHSSARPDMAQITMGVVTEAKTAQEALAANNIAVDALLKTLKAKGIADKDVMTVNFNVSPQYRYDNPAPGSPTKAPVITGYNVQNEVRTKVRDVAKLGDILDAVVAKGANNVSGISFSLAEPDPALDEARKKAVADARRKAEIYAAASGIRVGRVLYISESGGYVSPPRPMMMASRADSAPGVSIAVGEQEMSATVTVTYAIDGVTAP